MSEKSDINSCKQFLGNTSMVCINQSAQHSGQQTTPRGNGDKHNNIILSGTFYGRIVAHRKELKFEIYSSSRNREDTY